MSEQPIQPLIPFVIHRVGGTPELANGYASGNLPQHHSRCIVSTSMVPIGGVVGHSDAILAGRQSWKSSTSPAKITISQYSPEAALA